MPTHEETGVPEQPAALTGAGEFAAAVAGVAQALFDASIDVEFEDDLLLEAAREKLA